MLRLYQLTPFELFSGLGTIPEYVDPVILKAKDKSEATLEHTLIGVS